MSRRAAIYARFSSDLQKDRSIDDQLLVCQSLASRENLEVVETFRDRAKSGASMFERDGLLDLMKAAAKRREFSVVIVESLDRLSRDQEDLAGIFKRLSYHEVEILTVNEGKTTSIHVGIRGIVGSLFLADLGAKVRRGHNGRVREGKFPGAVTYGYRAVPGKPGEREIEPTEAAIVRRIFKEYAAGISPRAIALALTADRIPTPAGAPAWNHQAFIGGATKRGIIGNPLYIGELVWSTTRNILNPATGKKTKRMGPADERVSASVPHLRIIDQGLWDAANQVRRDRGTAKFGVEGKVRSAGARLPAHDHLLAGLLRCAACGGHMRIANTSRDGSPRAACAAAHQHGTCGHNKSYDMDKLQVAVLDGMRVHLTDPAAIVEAARAFHAEYAEREKRGRSELVAARKRLNRVQVQIDRLVIAIRDSNLPVKDLVAQLNPLDAERAGLAERLRLLEAEGNIVTLHPTVMATYKINIERLHQALSRDTLTPENRGAFRNIIDSIVVHPTAKRMPYEFTPYGRLAAIMGVELFPTVRSAQEILAEEGIPCSENGNTGNSGVPLSLQLLPLGRWRTAA